MALGRRSRIVDGRFMALPHWDDVLRTRDLVSMYRVDAVDYFDGDSG